MKLTEEQIQKAVKALPTWKREGDTIKRTFSFKGFKEAIEFVNRVAHLAEERNHHPDIDIHWDKVTLALTTFDEGGLTELDFNEAKELDALAQS